MGQWAERRRNGYNERPARLISRQAWWCAPPSGSITRLRQVRPVKEPMTPNEDVIEQFYRSFQRGDAAGMIACYDPAIEFSDPVFGALRGPQVGAMWQMLTGRAQDFQLTYRDIHADAQSGSAAWEATYVFSQ